MNIKTIEEQCKDYFDYSKLVHSVKTISIINLQVNNLTLNFGNELAKYCCIINTNLAPVDMYGSRQTADIKISGESLNDVLDTAAKIRAFCAVSNYEALIK